MQRSDYINITHISILDQPSPAPPNHHPLPPCSLTTPTHPQHLPAAVKQERGPDSADLAAQTRNTPHKPAPLTNPKSRQPEQRRTALTHRRFLGGISEDVAAPVVFAELEGGFAVVDVGVPPVVAAAAVVS